MSVASGDGWSAAMVATLRKAAPALPMMRAAEAVARAL
jgi:hypothetical protein